MPKQCYQLKRFNDSSLAIIAQAEAIMGEYAEQGFDLTLRQLYYQFVARGILPNNMRSYKRLGSIVNDARLAGLLDWSQMVDRTRHLRALAHWGSPSDILNACAGQYRIDKWATQPWRVEVWVEKDALIGVVETVCQRLDVPCFSCRGYTSQSELWQAGNRIRRYAKKQQVRVLHLGDHDPSGVDMTRDIADRLFLFTSEADIVKRIALTMEQVEELNPPPNPAKQTDARFMAYRREFGAESWELDALDPSYIDCLVTREVQALRDEEAWARGSAEEEGVKASLASLATRWPAVTRFLSRKAT